MSDTKNTTEQPPRKSKHKKKEKPEELTLKFDFTSIDSSIIDTTTQAQAKIVTHLLNDTSDMTHKFDGEFASDVIEPKKNLPEKKIKERSKRNSLSFWNTASESKSKKESKSTETEEKSDSTSSISSTSSVKK